jgi:hypothetical protein
MTCQKILIIVCYWILISVNFQGTKDKFIHNVFHQLFHCIWTTTWWHTCNMVTIFRIILGRLTYQVGLFEDVNTPHILFLQFFLPILFPCQDIAKDNSWPSHHCHMLIQICCKTFIV